MRFGKSRDGAECQARRLAGRRCFSSFIHQFFAIGWARPRIGPTVVGPLSGLKQWAIGGAWAMAGHRHGRESPRMPSRSKKSDDTSSTPPCHPQRDKVDLHSPRHLGSRIWERFVDANSKSTASHRSGRLTENRQESVARPIGDIRRQRKLPCASETWSSSWSPQCRPRLQWCLALMGGTFRIPGDCFSGPRGK